MEPYATYLDPCLPGLQGPLSVKYAAMNFPLITAGKRWLRMDDKSYRSDLAVALR